MILKRLFIAFAVFSLLTPTLLIPKPAKAITGSDFQAGRIMDDGVFFNPNSIGPDGIQVFLNSKIRNGSCDTNGSQSYSGGQTRAQYGASKGYPAPYTCLKDYGQNTPWRAGDAGLCGTYGGGWKSSAQIIYEVGQACGVNPMILLVLLEKEQSLVTDDWPWSLQYQKATGFGCPDTAPCDPQFGAFFDQVYYAARQFKRYARDESSFRYRAFRTNYVQYHPNSACGGTNLYIQNQTTAGLYNYTPYQPNGTALSNIYGGQTDGCSSYGNRNFWRLYNDWFGSVYANDTNTPHPNGTVISDGIKVYVIEANTKRHITNPWVFASYRYDWNQVKRATTGDNLMPNGTPVTDYAPGTLIRTDNSPTYVIEYEGGVLKKRALSYSAFMGQGYNWNEVMYVPPAAMQTATMNSLLNTNQHASGSVIVNRSQGKVYYVEMDALRYVDSTTFISYNFSFDRVKDATPEDIALPVSSPYEPRQGAVFHAAGIYIIDRDQNGAYKRPVGPWECYADRWYFTSSDWRYVTLHSLPARTGQLFTC